MNTFGKVLVILIFIASIIFMGSAMGVWLVNRNHRQEIIKPGGWKDRLSQEQQRNQQLETEKAGLQQELENERTAKRMALARLESERQTIQQELNTLTKERAQLVQSESQSAAALAAIQKNLEAWRGEMEGLRGQVRTAQQDSDKHFRRVVALTDQIHQVEGELTAQKDRNAQLQQQIVRYENVLNDKGIPLDTAVADLPTKVEGLIDVVRGGRYVELNIGSDDGLRPGDTLEVYRGAQYLGRLRVTSELEPDRAVAEILKDLQKGAIREGDHVTTRFKVG
jgi:predicted  nucleic acid-binding Zn-ribbon protein